jgi:replication factor A1
MHKTKDEIYELIKDIKTKNEFEKEIQNRKKEYDDLLDEESIALLIIDELGRNKYSIVNFNELIPGLECTVIGTIIHIENPRSFTRKNGSNGKVANLVIADETGNAALVLWNEDTDLLNNTLKINSHVKIINGYTKKNRENIEINVGKWSKIEILDEKQNTKNPIKTSTNNGLIIEGIIEEIQPTHPFFKDNGDYGFVSKMKITSNNEILNITVWDEQVKTIQNFSKNDKIRITNFNKRVKDKILEYHVNGKAQITKL